MTPAQRRQRFAEANWYSLCQHVVHGTARERHGALVREVLDLPQCAAAIDAGTATERTADVISERVVRLSGEFARIAAQQRALRAVL